MIDDILKKLAEGKNPSAVEVEHMAGLGREEVAAFIAGWTELAAERRQAILKLAAELAENDVQLDFGDIFKAALSDPDPLVRVAAIEGLWEDEDFRTSDRIVALLRSDPDERVRVAAALGLARFAVLAEEGTLYAPAARRLREGLLATARDAGESAEVRRRTIEALGVLSEDGVAGLIEAAYADADDKTRASAIYAMGRALDERWLPIILDELENENPELRFEAARAAGLLGSGRALVPLITLLDDADLEVRLAAVGALGEIGGDVARKALRRCAKSEEAAMRDAANEALDQMDIDNDPLSMAPFLSDNTPTV
jgi:HEAT repeat protein